MPPGPRGIPILGNMLQIPQEVAFRKFAEWAKIYGPVYSLNVAGKPIVVVSELKAARELLGVSPFRTLCDTGKIDQRHGSSLTEGRSAIYSDRPRMILAGEMMVGGLSFGFMPCFPYTSWRRHRRAAHEAMKDIDVYSTVQQREAVNLVIHLLDEPEEWRKYCSRTTASNVISMVYGTALAKRNLDTIVKRIGELIHVTARAAVKDVHPVEFFPVLAKLPSWLWFSKWKRDAQAMFHEYSELFESFLHDAKLHMVRSSLRWSVCVLLSESDAVRMCHDDDQEMSLSAYLIKEGDSHGLSTLDSAWLAGILISAGTDTTTSGSYTIERLSILETLRYEPAGCAAPVLGADCSDEVCSRPDDEQSSPEPSHDGAPAVEQNAQPSEEILPRSSLKKRRIQPDDEAQKFFRRFHAILPDLEEPYLRYVTQSLRRPVHTSDFECGPCTRRGCSARTSQVMLLYWDHFETRDVPYCECTLLPVRLVQNDFYSALFERSGDAVTAMAGALHKFYTRRGWRLGASIADPFRRGLGHAIQWYDVLKVTIERRVDDAIDRARHVVTAYQESSGNFAPPLPGEGGVRLDQFESSPENKVIKVDTQRCADILRKRCPACFGGRKFARPLSDGGDIHVALDANFSHRHLRSAGDSPEFYDSSHFISDEFVQEIDKRIQTKRKRPRNKNWTPPVPDSVLDACEHGHEAANEHKVKTATLRYDDTGVMAMICRHDIPLFLVNMDTPGEQQKYAIALLEHLFNLLPSNATVKALYDIGCLLDRSIHLGGRYLPCIRTGMDGHVNLCMLPGFKTGSGETDGEGVERLWSRLRIIIHVTRSSARSRRIWIIDRQVNAIGESALEDLGTNIDRRYGRAARQLEKALEELRACNEGDEELQRQWEHQRKEQTSVRNHAPARLKKDLDAILTLQSEVDKLENVISSTEKLLKITYKTNVALGELARLRDLHLTLAAQVDHLYASLNVDHLPPALKSLPLEFLRDLILARDLKMNLRSRVIAHWLEWDRLDQAASGKDAALGTKLHQETRKKIAKRKPAVITAIKKYNGYCELLKILLPSGFDFPLPRPLPTDLVALRDCPHFMEDVWIAPSATATPPRWLEDENVRRGILARHRHQRAVEEKKRCGEEAENMCRWFGLELTALEVALRTPENILLAPLLQERYSQHGLRRHKWPTHLVSDFRYDYHWMPPIILQEHLLTITDDDGAIDDTADNGRWDCPEDVLLFDLIQDALDDDEELPIPPIEPPESSVVLPWESCAQILPETRTSPYESPPMSPSRTSALNARWTIPAVFRADCFWEIWFFANISLPDTTSTFTRGWSFEERRVCFSPSDLARLADPHAQLNDICIDDCAALLREVFGNVQQACAVFTTFEVSSLRRGAHDTLSRSARRNRYWERDIWLLPLYQEDRKHWTLAVLIRSQRAIYQFDSFADETFWRQDVQDALSLVETLLGHDTSLNVWTAYPLSTTAQQTNGYDCGVWVLATMAAIMRGYEVTGLKEPDMHAFRKLLLCLALCLPGSAMAST
ncbi:hypothetical protein NM688_g740 [Phlebia brevispora]|uniref:Uncharacterized protein n=1 Tax=Phlebia brevispora TaxID=194682 RepID=A0ACC1TDH3_9APHY|nr:hypothetical protein NM688_g740 [Phlebia brevispora]